VTKGKKEITMIPWEKIDQYLTDWQKTESESPATLSILSAGKNV
jgi:hypothetical protein